MIIHLCLYKGLLSCIILAFTSSTDTWSAARVILAIALFSLVATFSSQNYTTERRLVSQATMLAPWSRAKQADLQPPPYIAQAGIPPTPQAHTPQTNPSYAMTDPSAHELQADKSAMGAI